MAALLKPAAYIVSYHYKILGATVFSSRILTCNRSFHKPQEVTCILSVKGQLESYVQGVVSCAEEEELVVRWTNFLPSTQN